MLRDIMYVHVTCHYYCCHHRCDEILFSRCCSRLHLTILESLKHYTGRIEMGKLQWQWDYGGQQPTGGLIGLVWRLHSSGETGELSQWP